ncbi:YIP1 family protein [Candidatus Marsarchaeota archaeon]|jgi:hypothetical protein|nr:YIP1 family protein [Candidatus Marsarchaeota archaeon]MCL5092634.1 YIP1 family protein [Candidatus Marsarchaeota archaeon]
MIKEFKQAIEIMVHPSKASNKMDIGQSYGFYYRYAIIPLLAAVIVSGIAVSAITGLLFGVITAVGALIEILAIIPLSIILGAAYLHLFGYLFKKFKAGFEGTLAAVVYGTIPALMFYWLIALISYIKFPIIQFISIIVDIVFGIWGLVVAIYALSAIHGISKKAALGVYIVAAVIPLIIILIVVLLFAVALF